MMIRQKQIGKISVWTCAPHVWIVTDSKSETDLVYCCHELEIKNKSLKCYVRQKQNRNGAGTSPADVWLMPSGTLGELKPVFLFCRVYT